MLTSALVNVSRYPTVHQSLTIATADVCELKSSDFNIYAVRQRAAVVKKTTTLTTEQ